MAGACCNLWSLVEHGGFRQLHFYLQRVSPAWRALVCWLFFRPWCAAAKDSAPTSTSRWTTPKIEEQRTIPIENLGAQPAVQHWGHMPRIRFITQDRPRPDRKSV